MSGIIIHFLYCTDLYDLACIHDCYSVCHTCNHSQIMGYQYGSCSKLHLYFPQKIQNLCLYSHIQCSSWFICK